MVDERARQLVRAPLGRALLAEIVGFDTFVVDKGIDLGARVRQATPHLEQLSACDEPLALLAALQSNPLGFGFHGDHAEWDARLSAGADYLLPVAEALVSCPAASLWWDHLDVERQRWVTCDHRESEMPRGETLGTAVSQEVEHELTRQMDPQAIDFYKKSLEHPNYSGHWWSAPRGAGVVFTSPAGPGSFPCLELATMEDPLGKETFEVWSVDILGSARVFEVKQPDDWARLVELGPVDVTMTRDMDWSRWSGRHRTWFLPDWRVVGEQFDAVHIPLGGYLATRGMAIDVSGGWTFLAGWDAGTTLWLRDTFGDVHRLDSWTGQPGGDGLPEPLRLIQFG